ncbi:hypothetical protein OG552_00290 [Streptomyces sp. NBC_01476]|uniref:hypothetical protein n=1 Tax=Streptomyces sp. NBC_01476 TaxID=2903881 RepID=UPI002E32FDBA|nr:hypothetical protein [Streptomyces sp. NBC_01476]
MVSDGYSLSDRVSVVRHQGLDVTVRQVSGTPSGAVDDVLLVDDVVEGQDDCART